MDHPATRPAKRPFGYPISGATLHCFCYPCPRHVYHRPVLLPSNAAAASNGWLAIKADKFLLPSPQPASPAFLERWDDGPPWQRDAFLDSHDWRALDDIAGTLFRFGPRPVWEQTVRRFHLRRHPCIRIGAATILPLALVQLIARLPRAEIRADTPTIANPVAFRFNGGRGVVYNHAPELAGQEATVVCPPRDNPLTT